VTIRSFRDVLGLGCLTLLLATVVASPAVPDTTTVYSSGNIAVPIPDDNPTGASVDINVPDAGTVTDVNVRVRINHTFDSDLAIGLNHSNAGNALSNNNDGSGDNYGTGSNDCSGTKTIFDDQAGTSITAGTPPYAGSFMPQSGLSIHNGAPSNGLWTVTVVDSVEQDTGVIGCVELEITRTDVTATPTATATPTVTPTPSPRAPSVPTLSSRGLALLLLLLASVSILFLRRR
jgi:subtilisin-like proprotein convertase family protein